MTPDDRYASFMLRFQWMKNDKQPTWIVSMQKTGTGELRWFPNLEALITFLREEFGDADAVCEPLETEGCKHNSPEKRSPATGKPVNR